MKAFTYVRPESVEDALTWLPHNGKDGSRPLAGGTDILTLMKAGVASPASLMDVKRLPELNGGIQESADGVNLGALVTLAEIEANPVMQERYTALATAAASAATPQLRNMATLGGNLLQRPRCWYYRNPNLDCWLKGGDDCPARNGENQLHALFADDECVAVHPSDPAAALVVLNAEVRLRGPNGERSVAAESFFSMPSDDARTETVARPEELIVSIDVPAPPENARSVYLKAMDRKVWSFALVGCAASIQMTDGLIEDIRLVLTGVAPTPWRLNGAEDLLRGSEPNIELFNRVAEVALQDARPLMHNGYKVPLARALIRRALSGLTIAAGDF